MATEKNFKLRLRETSISHAHVMGTSLENLPALIPFKYRSGDVIYAMCRSILIIRPVLIYLMIYTIRNMQMTNSMSYYRNNKWN